MRLTTRVYGIEKLGIGMRLSLIYNPVPKVRGTNLVLVHCMYFNIQRHPEGIATLAFKEFEAADECVLKMNGRWYGGQQLEVSPWDGVTNYQVEETDQERGTRLSAWEKFLEEEEESSKGETQVNFVFYM